MNMYFILYWCDLIFGWFFCENVVEVYYVKRGYVILLFDFYKFLDKEVLLKCMYGCLIYLFKILVIIYKILFILFYVLGLDYKDESKVYLMVSY